MKTFECGHCSGLNEITGVVDDVKAFHIKFNQAGPDKPCLLPEMEERFRVKCLKEEVAEFEAAKTIKDKLDALIDLIYFAIGTAHRMGLLNMVTGVSIFLIAWRRVHLKNMEKELSSPDAPSKRGPEFNGHDIVKPKGWTPAELGDLTGEN
jgi:predicted HAD superfamily Cof-like phosphohydrolase